MGNQCVGRGRKKTEEEREVSQSLLSDIEQHSNFCCVSTVFDEDRAEGGVGGCRVITDRQELSAVCKEVREFYEVQKSKKYLKITPEQRDSFSRFISRGWLLTVHIVHYQSCIVDEDDVHESTLKELMTALQYYHLAMWRIHKIYVFTPLAPPKKKGPVITSVTQ